MDSNPSPAQAASQSDSVVIIPTYNEKENISAIIDAVMNLPHAFDVLVIDDGSPDGTADIVREKMKERPGRIHLVERAGKQGLGTAYIAGFKWALERPGSTWPTGPWDAC